MRTILQTPLPYLLIVLLLPACNRDNTSHTKEEVAQDHALTVADAWARPAAEGTNSAAYMMIYNRTPQSDTLVAISTGVAAMAEVHESYEEDGMAGMRPAGELVIQAGNHLELKPGGFHVMLMQLGRPLTSGDSLQLNLQFAVAGAKEVTAVVQ